MQTDYWDFLSIVVIYFTQVLQYDIHCRNLLPSSIERSFIALSSLYHTVSTVLVSNSNSQELRRDRL